MMIDNDEPLNKLMTW